MLAKLFVRASVLVVFVLALCAVSFAQSDLDTVTFSGKITDAQGLPVVGATITATRVETGDAHSATSNDDGLYRIINLRPGNYKVTAAQSGFGVQETPPIPTIAAQNVTRDFKLSPAGVKAETNVTVTDEDSPVIDTTRTVVGGTVTQREIEELPVDSRNPLDLVLTLGGTAEEQLSTRDLSEDRGVRGVSTPGTTPEEAGIFSLSGGAAYSNNITIDGMDNNDDRGATFRFQPSMDAVREVQVITNQFSAEYGRASGGRVNLATRGGDNRFRGRAYYYFRDESLNANTWNNNRRGISKPPLQENDPGFTFGGPIKKNKLFFFASYEHDNIFDTTVLDAWVPMTLQNSRFGLPAPNNPSAGTVIVPGGAACPPPVGNTCPANVVIGNYLSPTDTPAKTQIFNTRVDWTIGKSQNITFNWQVGRLNDLRAFSGTNRIADSIIGRIRNTDAYNVTHNWFSGNKVNQFRLQYSKLDPSAAQSAGATAPAVLVTFTPPASSSTTQTLGSTLNASDRKENRWQVQDIFSLVRGTQTWRAGVDYQHVDTTFIDRTDASGTYSFSNYSFFLGNSVSRIQQNFGGNSSLLNKYSGVFVQDDWRFRPDLTVSFGVRYERESVIKDNNNWGPRVAVAWSPFKKGRGVIRFGAGIFYNRVLLRTVDDYTADSQTFRLDSNSFNVPAGTTVDGPTWRTFVSNNFPNPFTLDTVIPINPTQSFTVKQLSRAANVFRSLSPNLVIPESYQANIGFEHEVRKGLVFETNVTWNRTVHLWRETNPNAPVLPSGLSDVNGDGQITFTDYLLGVTTGTNRFYSGSPTDAVGQHTTQSDTGAACAAGSTLCFVNVNTTNNSSASSCAPVGTVINTPICRAFAAVNALRPFFSTLGAIQTEQVSSIGNSRYIGAIFELRKRYRPIGHGFSATWRLDYTLSKLMDDGIVNTSDPTLPGDFNREFSRSLSDRRHRIGLTATIDMPRWLGKIGFSPLFRWGSSAPYNLGNGGVDRNLDDLSNDRPNFFGNLDNIGYRIYGSTFPSALASQFAFAPIGSPGNLRRNAGHGPQLWQLNVNVTRTWKIGERFKIRPSLEVFNPLNMRIFSFGSNFIDFNNLSLCSAGTGLTLAQQETCNTFLAPTRTMNQRRMRLGIRFDF
ncbi:MAG: TonB-dependent receptor domain-containing protein [Pyrinomonadaceae bacterium]